MRLLDIFLKRKKRKKVVKKGKRIQVFLAAYPAHTAESDVIYLEKTDSGIYFIVVSTYGLQSYEFRSPVPLHIIDDNIIDISKLLSHIETQENHMHHQSFNSKRDFGYVDIDSFTHIYNTSSSQYPPEAPIRNNTLKARYNKSSDYISNTKENSQHAKILTCKNCGALTFSEKKTCIFCNSYLYEEPYTPLHSELQNKRTICVKGQHVIGCEYTEISVGQFKGKYYYTVSQMTDPMNAGSYTEQVPQHLVVNGNLDREGLLKYLGY